jgi:hypothetical protein
MKKAAKTILLYVLIAFWIGLPAFSLANSGLEINSDNPMFSVGNFYPGQSVTADIEIINNYDKKGEVKVETREITETKDNFSSYLELFIKKNGEKINCGTINKLSPNKEGWCDINNLEKGESEDFQFEINFLSDAGNQYQSSSIEFDIVIGLFTSDSQSNPQSTYTISGIGTDDDETSEINVNPQVLAMTDQAVIFWETDDPTKGGIIYGEFPNLFNFENGAPTYGYNYFQEGVEDTFHQITLNDLDADTRYYYRVVSENGSLWISEEFSFTTLQQEGEIAGAETVEEKKPVENKPDSEVKNEDNSEEEKDIDPKVQIDEKDMLEDENNKQEKSALQSLTAAIGNFGNIDNPVRCLFFILLIIVLIYLIIKNYQQYKKDK